MADEPIIQTVAEPLQQELKKRIELAQQAGVRGTATGDGMPALEVDRTVPGCVAA